LNLVKERRELLKIKEITGNDAHLKASVWVLLAAAGEPKPLNFRLLLSILNKMKLGKKGYENHT